MTDRPWMTALEMQFATLSLERYLRTVSGRASVSTPYVLKHLPASTPLSWSQDATQAVWLAAQSLPDTARFQRHLLPDGLRQSWWWFDWRLPLTLKELEGVADTAVDPSMDVHGVCALLVAMDEAGLVICTGRVTRHAPMMTGLVVVSPTATLGEILAGDMRDPRTGVQGPVVRTGRDMALVRFVMAASIWLQQRILVTEGGHIERHRRKQLAREHAAVVPAEVKVIQLRRLDAPPRVRADDPAPVDWSCRWVVTGHWRDQPYADGTREVIFINPYVKGPPDLPLRVPSHTVYAVTR